MINLHIRIVELAYRESEEAGDEKLAAVPARYKEQVVAGLTEKGILPRPSAETCEC